MTRRSNRRGTAREYPRTARLNHLIHEIVAEEIERIDDERLGFLTVVAVEVEGDLRHATVWYSSFSEQSNGEEPAPVLEALEESRPRLQSAIARQTRIKRTPELTFKLDPVTRQAERVETILREITPDQSV